MKVVILGEPKFEPANIFESDGQAESMKQPIYDVDKKDFDLYHKVRVEIWSSMVYLEGAYKRMLSGKKLKYPAPKPILITTAMPFWNRLKFLFNPESALNKDYEYGGM